MAGTTVGFPDRYRAALRDHLAGSSADGIEAAYQLGRTAVAEGLSVLDLATVHHAGLADALEDSSEPVAAVVAAGDFLREALATFEVVARGYQEATETARIEHELAERQREISQTLQRSLLPPNLPDVPGLAVSARYHPAGEGLEVGGDFYDVFATEGDEWACVIGDVCGKGPEAAAVTALARHTLRAVASHEHIPSRILRRLSYAMREQRPDGRFVSVAYARVRQVGPELASLQLSLGGHPPALLRRADGTVEPIGEPGTLLGIVDVPTLTDVDVRLTAGDALVLYTDGVTDVRHAKREVFGFDDLREVVASAPDPRPAGLAATIEDEVLRASAGRPRDDVAVVTLGLAS